MLGSWVACKPMGKKIALVQCAASAASTACVFLGQGPSSNVSTTSPSRRKSWLLKCSNPKPGPPVVSISTTRAIPKALGFEHEGGEKAGQGEGGEDWATTVGARVAVGACAAAFPAAVAAVPDACPSTDATTAGGTAQKRTFLATKWRQIPPHTGQLRARTLLLLSACPTSNSKTQQLPWLAWTEFLNPTSMANSRWGQQPLLPLLNARPPCTASRHRICARPRAATRPPRRRAWPRIFVVGCRLPCDPPVGGHAHATEGTLARFDGAVCGHFAPQVRSAAFLRLAWRTSASAPSSERTMAQF